MRLRFQALAIDHNKKRWRMYILPECIAVGNGSKKRIDEGQA